jgi:DNA-binding transcriptional ArsR family regulator
MPRQKRTRLLAPLQERILAAVLLRPEREWYRSELARELGVPVSSLQRPLAALAASGIIRARQDGNRVYYRAETESPLYPELRGLLAKTSGLVDVLKAALESVAPRLKVAFVYGSIASGEETSASDVDLFVVGDAGLSELAPLLRKAATRLGREVNPTVCSAREFVEKLRSKSGFVQGVLDKPKLFVVGSEDDLGGT